MFRTTWVFDVVHQNLSAFLIMYGPEGDWVRLFRDHPGYFETLLLRDVATPSRFATIDVWETPKHYQDFLERADGDYKALGERGKQLVSHMAHAGASQ